MAIWIVDNHGQLGNQLATFAHLASHALDTGQAVYNPAFRRYANLFEGFADNFLCRYPIRASPRSLLLLERRVFLVMRNFLRKRALNEKLNLFHYQSLGHTEELDIREQGYDRLRGETRCKILALDGWMFRDFDALRRHRETIRAVFSYSSSIAERSAEWLNGIRQFGRPVIGIHIRRGDIGLISPDLVFDDDVFEAFAIRLTNLLHPHKPIFVLCSNEPISDNLVKKTGGFTSIGSIGEDQCILSRCDYIIGPTSTFSSWASFYGNVPAYLMNKSRPPESMEDFQIYQNP